MNILIKHIVLTNTLSSPSPSKMSEVNLDERQI